MKNLFPLFALSNALLLSAQESYHQVHSAVSDRWNLQFISCAKGSAFVMGGLAIEIIEIRCDGQRISPAKIHGAPRIDPSSFPEVVDRVVYSIGTDVLYFSVWENGTFVQGVIEEYRLPAKPKRIEISYKVHFPDKRPPVQNLLISVRADQVMNR